MLCRGLVADHQVAGPRQFLHQAFDDVTANRCYNALRPDAPIITESTSRAVSGMGDRFGRVLTNNPDQNFSDSGMNPPVVSKTTNGVAS